MPPEEIAPDRGQSSGDHLAPGASDHRVLPARTRAQWLTGNGVVVMQIRRRPHGYPPGGDGTEDGGAIPQKHVRIPAVKTPVQCEILPGLEG